jgi:hypothetical protein|tara:strand:+ start:113 stop:289 length:177 start_codon:yes stop_codon:yes gene_type:complete
MTVTTAASLGAITLGNRPGPRRFKLKTIGEPIMARGGKKSRGGKKKKKKSSMSRSKRR